LSLFVVFWFIYYFEVQLTKIIMIILLLICSKKMIILLIIHLSIWCNWNTGGM